METQNFKKKLDARISSLSHQYSNLKAARMSANKLMEDRRGPLRLAEKRVRIRARMPGPEKINDNVDRSLQKECEDLRNTCASLLTLIKEADSHLGKLDTHRQLMNADLEDKIQSLNVDQRCLEMQNMNAVVSGTEVRVENGVLEEPRGLLDRSPKLPNVWRLGTGQLLQESQELESQADKLRKLILNAIQNFEDSNFTSMTNVHTALKNKVQQSSQLQYNLSKRLQSINEELDQLQEERQQLMANISSKMGPLKVTRDRLAYRKQRPEREAIRDNVEEALEEELGTIKGYLANLQNQLDHVDAEQKRLTTIKSELERDWHNKNQALRLDRKCLALDVEAVMGVGDRTPPDTPSMVTSALFKSDTFLPRPPGSSVGSVVSVTSFSSGSLLGLRNAGSPRTAPRRPRH